MSLSEAVSSASLGSSVIFTLGILKLCYEWQASLELLNLLVNCTFCLFIIDITFCLMFDINVIMPVSCWLIFTCISFSVISLSSFLGPSVRGSITQKLKVWTLGGVGLGSNHRSASRNCLTASSSSFLIKMVPVSLGCC